jgi:hypothetical protein
MYESVQRPDSPSPTAEQVLAVLQAAYPAWHIWRSRIGATPAGWCATGTGTTLMDATAEGLHAQLAAATGATAEAPAVGLFQ